MAYNGIAWPGLTLSIKVITSQRGKVARALRLIEEQPKLFKRPRAEAEKRRREIADFDTGLQVLRAAQKATERPARKRRKMAENKPVEPIAS